MSPSERSGSDIPESDIPESEILKSETPDRRDQLSIELCVAPENIKALLRFPGLKRAGRTVSVQTLWYDTPGGDLAQSNRLVAETAGRWRLEQLGPHRERAWPPLSPAPVWAEGTSLQALALHGTAPLAPVAALSGRRSRFHLAYDPANDSAAVAVTLLEGELRGVAASLGICRIHLHGPAEALGRVSAALARQRLVSVPHAGLAAEAMAVARGQAVAARHVGAPEISPGLTLSDTIALIMGQLLDVILHWSGPAGAGETEVPVHQMRVATRRLRSALSIFKPVTPCAEILPLSPALKELAARLGAARDWDVFLAGTGASMQAAFPPDRRIKALLAAAGRKREAAYGELREYVTSPDFRVLQVALGCAASLRPWEHIGVEEVRQVLHQDAAPFAVGVLTRRWRQVRRAGRGMSALSVPALHELRKDCKRLRYAAEFFEPLYPHKTARRFIKHLAALQEELGMLNDAAAASGLMAHLGRAERSYAAGLVQGFVAAGASHSRSAIAGRWKSFRQQTPFWLP